MSKCWKFECNNFYIRIVTSYISIPLAQMASHTDPWPVSCFLCLRQYRCELWVRGDTSGAAASRIYWSSASALLMPWLSLCERVTACSICWSPDAICMTFKEILLTFKKWQWLNYINEDALVKLVKTEKGREYKQLVCNKIQDLLNFYGNIYKKYCFFYL